MKTTMQKLQEAYDWYLQSVCLDYKHGDFPLGFDEWLTVSYSCYNDGDRFNKFHYWRKSTLGSVQWDMEEAFKEYEATQFLPTEDEETAFRQFNYYRTHRDTPLYFAKKYVERMKEGEYEKMTKTLCSAMSKLSKSGLNEFNMYVSDLVRTEL